MTRNALIRLAVRVFLVVFARGAFDKAMAAEKRRLDFSDLAALRSVSDPQLSPEGDWIAYVVRTSDLENDRLSGDLWMTSWDGGRTIQLTYTDESESRPRFSPDGRYLSFLASRGTEEDAKSQVWLLDRAGGEARKLTDYLGGVSDYAWSPEGGRLAIIASDPDPDESAENGTAAKKKTPKPIVIDRYQFKQDRVGYLRRLRDHLYLYDVATAKSDLLTPGDYEEGLPSWSPDGSSIAFSSKRQGDPDRNENWDIFLIEAKAGATPRQLTRFEGVDNEPGWGSPAAFSPDGERIAYLMGSSASYTSYDMARLAVIPLAGGEPRLVTPELDRAVSNPTWSPDGSSLYFLLEDDRNQVVARVPAAGGDVERLVDARGVASNFTLSGSRLALVGSTPDEPSEVMALDGGSLRTLSTHNHELMEQVELGALEGIELESRDGTIVHGVMVKPPGYEPGRKYPTIAYIHGGPVGQDGYEFDFTWQILAANGYVVVAPNYRGSSGRGLAFTRAIEADWGNLEVHDVLAAVDHLVAQGIADPDRLGIGGWSYGGMTTNYTLSRDSRFKAAVSGASVSNMLAAYGTDQYIRQYENEVGLPWKDIQPYLKISHPFYHADRIRTPTLFLCGEKDFNVPLLNSEQMYQALKSLGVETQLVIYPGQYHGLTKPSYLRDRLERYVAWFDRFLKGTETSDH
ncbi:MAG TPA: S9 family peptidase [Vicinamibacteria bacterium]|nr:S9 family peptidase [Vicinamibacteria bacterium]